MSSAIKDLRCLNQLTQSCNTRTHSQRLVQPVIDSLHCNWSGGPGVNDDTPIVRNWGKEAFICKHKLKICQQEVYVDLDCIPGGDHNSTRHLAWGHATL